MKPFTRNSADNIDSNSDFAPGLNSITRDILYPRIAHQHVVIQRSFILCPSVRHHELRRLNRMLNIVLLDECIHKCARVHTHSMNGRLI
jgi:hypothetical protein